jgi:hypothetical protein
MASITRTDSNKIKELDEKKAEEARDRAKDAVENVKKKLSKRKDDARQRIWERTKINRIPSGQGRGIKAKEAREKALQDADPEE